ncbi:MAG: SDR family NAD(P)-dependent oxidoreductase, partial [Tepidisphaeraceae bacterium]
MSNSDRAVHTALITGASVGIGREIGRVCAGRGHNVVLVARNEAQLSALADELSGRHGVRAEVLPKDLSTPTASHEIVDELARRGILIDILVNNAGFGTHGLFWETDPARTTALVQVNVAALTELTRRL